MNIGGPNATGYLGFLRWYSSVVPIGTRIPIGASTPANLGDWEFANRGSDTSGKRQHFNRLVLVDTPVYSPVCNAGASQTVIAGSTLNLNGSNSYPLDGGTALTYSWSFSLTGTASLSATDIASPAPRI